MTLLPFLEQTHPNHPLVFLPQTFNMETKPRFFVASKEITNSIAPFLEDPLIHARVQFNFYIDIKSVSQLKSKCQVNEKSIFCNQNMTKIETKSHLLLTWFKIKTLPSSYFSKQNILKWATQIILATSLLYLAYGDRGRTGWCDPS